MAFCRHHVDEWEALPASARGHVAPSHACCLGIPEDSATVVQGNTSEGGTSHPVGGVHRVGRGHLAGSGDLDVGHLKASGASRETARQIDVELQGAAAGRYLWGDGQ